MCRHIFTNIQRGDFLSRCGGRLCPKENRMFRFQRVQGGREVRISGGLYYLQRRRCVSTTYIQVPCDILHTIVILRHHTTPSLYSKRCPDAKCVFHQRSLGRHKKDNRPTDSAGNLCGEGENAGKPFTFYFDVTQCAKLNSTTQPCPTAQVTVDR